MIVPPANRDSSTSDFNAFFFPCLIVLARTPSALLNKNG